MVRNSFLPEVTRMRDSFFAEEIIFDQYFFHLEALEVQNSGIIESTYTDYFNDCSKFFGLVGKELEGLPDKSPDVGKFLSEFRKSSAGVGAIKVQRAINNLEECVPRGNYLECQVAFRQMKREFQSLQNNLETYFELKYRFPHVHERDDGNDGNDGSDSD